MKRFIILLAIFAAAFILPSCEKLNPSKPTTYTVHTDIAPTEDADKYAYDITFFEYNETGEKIANNSVTGAPFVNKLSV